MSTITLRGQEAAQYARAINLAKTRAETTIDKGVSDWLAWMDKNNVGASKTRFQYAQYIRTWLQGVTGLPLSEIESDHIQTWVNQPETKQSTRKFKLGVIKNLFKYLSAKELVSPNPALLATIDFESMGHEQKEVKELKVFTDSDFRTLLAHLDVRIAEAESKVEKAVRFGHYQTTINELRHKSAMMTFWKQATIISRCSGLRMSDVINLEFAQLGPPLTVWTRKSQKRVQPFISNRELYNSATQFLVPCGEFVYPHVRKIYLNERTRPTLNNEFIRICKTAGLEGYSFHSLRASYSSECFAKGIRIDHIRDWLGHQDISTTVGYIKTP